MTEMTAPLPDRARRLLDFWFAPEGDPGRARQRDIRFESAAEFDAAVRERFLAEPDSF